MFTQQTSPLDAAKKNYAEAAEQYQVAARAYHKKQAEYRTTVQQSELEENISSLSKDVAKLEEELKNKQSLLLQMVNNPTEVLALSAAIQTIEADLPPKKKALEAKKELMELANDLSRAESDLTIKKREVYEIISTQMSKDMSALSEALRKSHKNPGSADLSVIQLGDRIAGQLTSILDMGNNNNLKCSYTLSSGFVMTFPHIKDSSGKTLEIQGKIPFSTMFSEGTERLETLKSKVDEMKKDHNKEYTGSSFSEENEIFNDAMIALEITAKDIQAFNHNTDQKKIEEAQLNIRDLTSGLLHNLNTKFQEITKPTVDVTSHTEKLTASKEARKQAQGMMNIMCGIGIGIGAAAALGCFAAAMLIPGVNVAVLGAAGIAGCVIAGTGGLGATVSNIKTAVTSLITDKKIEKSEGEAKSKEALAKAEKFDIAADLLRPIQMLANASVNADTQLMKNNELASQSSIAR